MERCNEGRTTMMGPCEVGLAQTQTGGLAAFDSLWLRRSPRAVSTRRAVRARHSSQLTITPSRPRELHHSLLLIILLAAMSSSSDTK